MIARLRPAGHEWPALAALAAWTLVPLALIVAHAAATGERFTGADGVIGADQLQYLAWARDAGTHGLASNLFDFAPSGHVYAQPLVSLSGYIWRLGVPLWLAYVLWKPIAIVVLLGGAAVWVRRMIRDDRGSRFATLLLCLFFSTPLAWIVGWAGLGSAATRAQVLQVGAELFPAGSLWGYLPAAIAIGLVPVALIATERATERGRLAAARGPLALAAVAAALVSWLHPWQGITLLLILAGLAAWGRLRGWRTLAVTGAAALAPLVYYLVLAKTDSAWKLSSTLEVVPHPPLKAVLVGLAPAIAVALLGLRRPGADMMERALLLWLPCGVVVFIALNSFPSHALEGLSFPLAVLAVRGWRRLRLPAFVAPLVVAALTLLAVSYDARGLNDIASGPLQEYYLSSSEAHALDWVRRSAPPGGVLAPPLFAVAIPSQTGRAVWVGHQFWSRDYLARAQAAEALFEGHLGGAAARSLVTRSGARVLVADCAHQHDLAPALGGLVAASRRFGCATVYELAGSSQTPP